MEIINKKFLYAVVGASNHKEKYGHKVFANLVDGGFNVIPVNDHESEIMDRKVYKNLTDAEKHLTRKIDVVIFVVPPVVTEQVLNEVAQLGIKFVWMQPGSESEKAVRFCKKSGMECVHDACIMFDRNKYVE